MTTTTTTATTTTTTTRMNQQPRILLAIPLVLASLLLPTSINAAECSFQNFCPSGVTRPNTLVEAAGNGLTCQTVSVGISFGMVPDEECENLLYAEVFCCPQEDEPDCHLCPNGSDDNLLLFGNRIVDGETCDEINRKLQLNPRSKSCDAWKGVYDEMKTINVQSYCGCPGMPAPNQCKLCGSEDNREIAKLVDPSAQVPTAGYSSMTCLELLDYASHLTSTQTCGQIATPEIQAACCAGSAVSSASSSLVLSRTTGSFLFSLVGTTTTTATTTAFLMGRTFLVSAMMMMII